MNKTTNMLKEIARNLDGEIEEINFLPNGSGFATMSYPLPKDHWLTQEGDNEPPMPFRMGTNNPKRKEWIKKITEAAKYAIRASTTNGTVEDFDPDAMVQNMIIGMLGYYTSDGLSHLNEIELKEE